MNTPKNPHGKGKTLVSCTVSDDVLEAIDYLAHRSGISRSAYAREAITSRVMEGALFPAQEISDRKHGVRYDIPKIIALRAAEKPTQPSPRRSAGA